MAEFILKDMVKRIGRSDDFTIDSAATSSEELGNPVYPPARRMLAAHGLSCEGKTARRYRDSDYDAYDLILGMDQENMYYMMRKFGGDPKGKIHNLLDFAGRVGEEVADPWYTGDFQATWDDLQVGCLALLNALNRDRPVPLDFSGCTSREELYAVLRNKMLWTEEYGSNLDALYDILTGLPHYGSVFTLTAPDDADLADYFRRIESVFRDAGVFSEESEKSGL